MARKGQAGSQTPHGGAAMSFDEIGKALGITRGGAWMAYKNALRKLRRPCNARKLAELKTLADLRRQGQFS